MLDSFQMRLLTEEEKAKTCFDTIKQIWRPLRIAFVSFAPFEFDGNTPYKEPLGGSESALCYLTEELTKLQHYVTVFNGNKHPRVVRGVKWLPSSSATEIKL